MHKTYYEVKFGGVEVALHIEGVSIDFDGGRLGIDSNEEIQIKFYPGMRKLTDLPAIPLALRPDADEMRAKLLNRGRKFESYVGVNYLEYDGVGFYQEKEQSFDSNPISQFDITGRVMVDPIIYTRNKPNLLPPLLAPLPTKTTVQALVSAHINQKATFDDIVKGKGQGLALVLHGPPGVGKTLTAECVAEYLQRPLYMASVINMAESRAMRISE